MNYLIPAFLGLIAGAVGSLIAPWVHWAIEKRRAKIEYRRNSIAEWRSQIEAFNWNEDSFGDSATYASMRPHMNPEVVSRIEGPRTYIVPNEGRGCNAMKQCLVDELSRLEVDWGLL